MERIKINIKGETIAIIKLKVRITDINYGNHVGNDAFVGIIHEARMQWLHQHQFTELNIAGTGLIMSDLIVEFKNESFYGEDIEIAITAGEISGVSFELFYKLTTTRDIKNILLANAKTGMVCYNYERKKIVALPKELKQILTTSIA
ncbi:MAG: thioesterase family protein [Ferruginibacter sp.]